jgi:hypothetical protein
LIICDKTLWVFALPLCRNASPFLNASSRQEANRSAHQIQILFPDYALSQSRQCDEMRTK